MDHDSPGGLGPGRSRLDVPQIFAAAGLIALALVGSLLAITLDSGDIDGTLLRGRIDELGPWGPAAIVVLMVIHCFVPFPAEIVALCAGAAFGPVLGTVLVWTGAMLGAALSFGLARHLGRAAVERLLAARYRTALDDWTRDQGAATLLVSRFVPVIAFNLVNYAAGLTRVSWWTFLWTTGVGILPLTF
ncbi:MAG: TVP38/TMEM64 family protein, partial [Pseudomonadota bacterium]